MGVTVTLDGMQNDGARREDWVRLVENVRGGTGADSLFGNAGPNAIEGGPGDDLIDPAAGRDDVSAGAAAMQSSLATTSVTPSHAEAVGTSLWPMGSTRSA